MDEHTKLVKEVLREIFKPITLQERVAALEEIVRQLVREKAK